MTADTHPFDRFVALGDSQTEGIGDPDGKGGHRGWADRFAALLAAANPGLRYANLAVRGRRAAQIRSEQLGPALAQRPDLAAVVAGMNDLIRPRFDQAAVLADIDAMLAALTAAGARVVTFTFPDIGGVAPIVRPLSARVRAMNARMRELARRPGVVLVDFEPVTAATDRRLWAEDRLHLNPLGHDLVARAVAETLGLPGADGAWRQPLPPFRRTVGELVGGELRWAALHMAPWIGRRLRGVSTGADITAKRPGLLPILD
ncbi:SGNH/GDSL hydrolase family protein [Nocardia terpenica]|uniref:Lysophospholipase n=1 Tax=Nocardia terpenica TaxID=455432 RepID=A0A291RKY1_9NOCA|nr:SGNH/GDSL hydrolase family protein [Nocardia terpenica]ATL67950.1 lysophospholipase [Nocardia terpenica]